MSATDELRRLLDERGVEWGTGFGGHTLWTGRHGIEWRWDKQEGILAMYSHAITPEQAIEATLGRTCEVEDTSFDELDMYPHTWLSCGHHTLLMPSEINYCPECGARVVVVER